VIVDETPAAREARVTWSRGKQSKRTLMLILGAGWQAESTSNI
jgi:hypothetical protein